MNSTEFIEKIDQNTTILEETLDTMETGRNKLQQENMYLKSLVAQYLRIINQSTLEKFEPIEQTIAKLFLDENVKKFKGNYIKLNQLRLMLTLKHKVSNEMLYDLLIKSKYFEIHTIKKKLYVSLFRG